MEPSKNLAQLGCRVESVGAMAKVVTPSAAITEYLLKKCRVQATGSREFHVDLAFPIDATHLWMPRAYVSGSGVKIKSRVDWRIENVFTNFTLKPVQTEMVNNFLNRINSDSPYGGILKAQTGMGKTIMGTHIFSKLGLRTLVIVPLDRLMGQWRDQLKKFTNLKDHNIGTIRGPICDVKDKKIVLAMIHSLAQRKYPGIYDMFGMIVFDEIHVLGAETFARTAPMFDCKIRLGLSATPRRKDNMAEVFWSHIGDVISTSAVRMSKPKIVFYPYNALDTSHNGCVWHGKLNLGRYINRLEASANRNVLIAKIILKLREKGHDVLLLSDRVKMVKILGKVLEGSGLSGQVGYITGTHKTATKPVMLATYGSAGMGVDLPNVSALVLATPRVDVEQAAGRLRGLTGKEEILVDVVDTASNIMVGWARSRKRFYMKNQLAIDNRAGV